MSTQFEFRLSGAEAPDGELRADHLIALIQSLAEVASKIGRMETDAERVGRSPRRVKRVATLTIGLAPGSTRVLARRAGAGDGALAFDLPDEQSFDRTFATLIEAIAVDRRPNWVGDSLALAAADLTAALQQCAHEVEFKVDGLSRSRFRTSTTHRETWQVRTGTSTEDLTFIGHLFAVNLYTHRLQVQDDVGHVVRLPKVPDDVDVGHLIGSRVVVVGLPEFDAQGRLVQILGARVTPAPAALPEDSTIPAPLSVEAILTGAPGVEPGAIEGLTDAEADAFFEAIGR
jgi:hypothetical protein